MIWLVKNHAKVQLFRDIRKFSFINFVVLLEITGSITFRVWENHSWHTLCCMIDGFCKEQYLCLSVENNG